MKRFNFKFGEYLFQAQVEEVKAAWNAFLKKQKSDMRYCINRVGISPLRDACHYSLAAGDTFETFTRKKLASYFKKYRWELKHSHILFNDLEDIDACVSEAAKGWRAEVKDIARKEKEQKEILKNVDKYMKYGLLIGVNYEEPLARYEDFNKIEVIENEEKYSNSCRYKKIVRYVRVSIKRGYSLHDVGGLYTIIRGNKIDRKGMPCVWCEQGKAYSDTKMVSGYLVRGEHIEAKTLKQALKISAEHRASALERILSDRHFKQQEKSMLEKTIVRIEDSIAGGNCMPGTMNFKHRIEEELGEEINELSAEQVLYYGKKFGLLLYAERAVKVALNKK